MKPGAPEGQSHREVRQGECRLNILICRDECALMPMCVRLKILEKVVRHPENRCLVAHAGGMTVMYEGLLDVHYGYFDVCAGADIDEDLIDARRGQANGLCGAKSDHRLAMVTGLHTGDVPLRIEWHTDEPRLDPEWEDVVEASLDVSTPDGMLSSFEDGAVLTFPQSGWHRARYCAAGMDAGKDLDTPDEGELAPDRYLLQLWPAPATPDEIVKESSAIAGYWHRVARGEA